MSLLVMAAILFVSAGCERTDYEAVILKQKMRELEERVVELEDQVDEGTVRGPGEATEAVSNVKAETAVVAKSSQCDRRANETRRCQSNARQYDASSRWNARSTRQSD